MGTTVVGAGTAFHLQPSLLSYASGGANCTEKNGCGVHVHSGFSCENTTTQGGHYFDGSVDPWAVVGYTSTDGMGNASFAFMIRSTASDVVGKPFIIHDNAGGRVSCGMLMEAENAPPASGLTTTVEPQDAVLSTASNMSSTNSLRTTAEPQDAVLSTASSMSSTNSLRTTAEPQDVVLSTATSISSTNSLRTT